MATSFSVFRQGMIFAYNQLIKELEIESMKQILSLLIALNVSLAVQASPECEDVIELSRVSTQVSRDVHAFEESRRGLPPNRISSPEYQQQLLEISRKVVEDAAEVSNWGYSGVADSDYERIQNLKSDLEDFTANQSGDLLQRLERSELQYANHLRYTTVNRVRAYYASCFSTNGN